MYTYQREQEQGAVMAIQAAMTAALKTHPDPAMFIVNALITVGTFAGLKSVDPEFELAISVFLVEVLQKYLQWYEDHPSEREVAPNSSSSKSAPNSSTSSTSQIGFHYGETPSPENPKPEDDLIMLEEPESRVIFKPRNSYRLTAQPLPAQHTGSSAVSLLDDDVGSKRTLQQLAVLQPSFPNLIDLSNIDGLDGSSSTSTNDTTPRSSADGSFKSISVEDEGYTFAEDSDQERGDVVFQVDLKFLDKANELVATHDRQRPGQQSFKQHEVDSDLEELVEIFSNRLDTMSSHTESITEDQSDSTVEGIAEEHESGPNSVIQQRHRSKLLEEALEGKNVLQAFAAIDVLGMRPYLEECSEDGTETYGWLLARQLYEKGRFREASVLVFEYLHASSKNSSSNQPSLLSTLSLLSTPSSTEIRVNRPGSARTSDFTLPVSPSMSPGPTRPPPPPTLATPPTPTFVLPPEVKIVFVDSDAELDMLADALSSSTVVGMDTEWLPQIEEFEMHQTSSVRTAILQLACDSNSTVYIVDAVSFLESDDYGMGLVEVMGAFFNSRRVQKLAYDWEGDQDLLLSTFPGLFQEKFRPRNLLDMKHLWFKVLDNNNNSNSSINDDSDSKLEASEDVSPFASQGQSYMANSFISTSPSGSGSGSTSSSPGTPAIEFKCWSLLPSIPDMWQIPGGLSGMLTRLCGRKLDKSQQCSHWEQRPLSHAQQVYAAVDAWCLLEINAVLEKIERL
ncbi:Exonuclease mut-7 [Dissophora globulifera]|nr:Exonuclease mut-7 [Dissophora globulifera]